MANYLSLSESRVATVATSLRASSVIECLLAISPIGELARKLIKLQQCFNSKVTPPPPPPAIYSGRYMTLVSGQFGPLDTLLKVRSN